MCSQTPNSFVTLSPTGSSEFHRLESLKSFKSQRHLLTPQGLRSLLPHQQMLEKGMHVRLENLMTVTLQWAAFCRYYTSVNEAQD